MQEKQETRQVSLSYLRAFATPVVVVHHSAHAYTTFKHRFGYSTIGHNWT
jgi:hypothetical protein